MKNIIIGITLFTAFSSFAIESTPLPIETWKMPLSELPKNSGLIIGEDIIFSAGETRVRFSNGEIVKKADYRYCYLNKKDKVWKKQTLKAGTVLEAVNIVNYFHDYNGFDIDYITVIYIKNSKISSVVCKHMDAHVGQEKEFPSHYPTVWTLLEAGGADDVYDGFIMNVVLPTDTDPDIIH